MGNQMGLKERMSRAVCASEAFALRWAYGSAALGFTIGYGGNVVIGWLYYDDPGYYYWTPGTSYTDQMIRAWTEFGAPNVALLLFAIAALAAWTLYVLPSEDRIRTLEGRVGEDDGV